MPSDAHELRDIAEAYFENLLELSPLFATSIGDHRYDDRFPNSIAPEHREKLAELHARGLEQIRALDRSRLEGQDRLTYDVLERDCESTLEGLSFPTHLIPFNQFSGTPIRFAKLGSGKSIHPFRTVQDYDNFLHRIDGFVHWVEQAMVNMREGIELGVVNPRILMEKTRPQLEAHVVENADDSLFYEPVRNFPGEIDAAERRRLKASYEAAIEEKIVPAYRRLLGFVSDTYLPRARESIALTELPRGEDWYRHLVRYHTTVELSPDEIHRAGVDEVERIRAEMDDVKQAVGFRGSLAEFFEHVSTDESFCFDTEDELLDAFREIRERVEPRLADFFDIAPDADYEIRPVEAFRAKSAAGAEYQRATPDGSRPGVFYVNTFDLKAQAKYGTETLSLHEASPGHHFQISIQQSIEDLPRFRRFLGYTAYTEGWALYAESMGKELGMFTDPFQYYGRLNDEMLRAMRLVVDTGMHAKGWSRQQAVDYMRANSSIAASDVVSEVERYVALPGQALAYKLGELKIRELRTRAETALGSRFDVRGFHRTILTTGSVPLGALETRVDEWIDAASG